MKKAAKHIVFFSFLVIILFPPKAEAYLDPGTGSYVIQMLAAGLFGGLFIVKTWWREIKHFVSRIILRKEATSEKSSKREK